MQRIKLNLTSAYYHVAGGESFLQWPVIESTPGYAPAIIELPDDWDDTQIDAQVQTWIDQGLVTPSEESGNWRREHRGYRPLGWMEPGVLSGAPGDTFPMLGVSADTQKRGNWGALLIGHVDTGVDGSHPWFAGKNLQGDVSLDHVGHGTFCAGIFMGLQGIASDASLIEVAALASGTGTESDIASGIRQCANAGAQVLNLSIGGSGSSVMDAACQYAQQLGCIVVAAAGNTPNVTIGSPARAADVIVLAIDRDHKYASFTSGTNWNNPNRCTAPGVDDVSASVGGGTTSGSGTSFSCPHVVGLLALLRGSGLNRADALSYLWGHRSDPPNSLTPVLTDDFGSVDPPGPPDEGVLAKIHELAQGARVALDVARYNLRGSDEDYAWSSVGVVADPDVGPLASIEHLSEGTTPLPPPPPPDPQPQFVSPLPNGAVYGKTKWQAGSLGCDLFVKRGTPVVAPAACIVEEIRGGSGLQGGDELILATTDKQYAWRYRHTQARTGLGVGDHVDQGGVVGQVLDASLDNLGNPPAWSQPMPDKYQHLDLSMNEGTDQFSPIGGSGGNYNVYDWLQTLHYQGRVLARTPGPSEGVPWTKEQMEGDRPLPVPAAEAELAPRTEPPPKTKLQKRRGPKPKSVRVTREPAHEKASDDDDQDAKPKVRSHHKQR